MLEKMGTKKLEKHYYPILKSKLGDLFQKKYGAQLRSAPWLEVTDRGIFSPAIKSKIPQGRDIIFSFLKSSYPDITGILTFKEYNHPESGFVVAEFKMGPITLDNIYQLKRYVDLFDARYGFLFSLERIPEEVKRLYKALPPVLKAPRASVYEPYRSKPVDKAEFTTLTLASFDEDNDFYDWFPENPFRGDIRKLIVRRLKPPGTPP